MKRKTPPGRKRALRPLGADLAEAWQEYLANHRDQFAKDLEEAARLLRHGTHEELAEFANRNSKARAEKAAERIQASD